MQKIYRTALVTLLMCSYTAPLAHANTLNASALVFVDLEIPGTEGKCKDDRGRPAVCVEPAPSGELTLFSKQLGKFLVPQSLSDDPSLPGFSRFALPGLGTYRVVLLRTLAPV